MKCQKETERGDIVWATLSDCIIIVVAYEKSFGPFLFDAAVVHHWILLYLFAFWANLGILGFVNHLTFLIKKFELFSMNKYI